MHRALVLAPLLAGLLVLRAGPAHAQPQAVGSSPPGLPHRHPPSALGGTLLVGAAGQVDGPDGYVVRLDQELFPVFPSRGDAGAFFGFLLGLEHWRSGDAHWGVSIPFAFVFGVSAPLVRASLGYGFDTLLIDEVAGDIGVGAMAPLGLARLGVDVRGVQLGVDARIGYRLQLGADDHTRWQLGVFAGYTLAPRR